MQTIYDKLLKIKQIKSEIKQELISKGLEPGDKFEDYIKQISYLDLRIEPDEDYYDKIDEPENGITEHQGIVLYVGRNICIQKMKTSDYMISKLIEFEGCKLTSYRCPAGVWTIGVGHTGKDVKPNMTITKEQAITLLKKDLVKFENYVNSLKICTNQNQFDALVSFSFNVGTAALGKSTLLKYIRARKTERDIRIQFNLWVKAGGKTLPGLQKRRMFESDLYFKK